MTTLRKHIPYLIPLSVGILTITSSCTESSPIVVANTDDAVMGNNFPWLIFAIIGIIFVAVTLIFAWAIWRNRTDDDIALSAEPENEQEVTRLILIFGSIIPATALLILMGISLFLVSDYSEFMSLTPDDENTLHVQVIGHQWWWEVRYPEHDVVTANEIVIPIEQPIQFHLTSDDIIHSLWLPELNAMLNMSPGETSVMLLDIDEVGIYEGLCGEYCGLQHANMRFEMIGVTEDEFSQWIDQQAQPAPLPDTTDSLVLEGYQAFMGSACVYCHTIRGTQATGVIGPDLTHIASRNTLGAGILPNNHGNLMGWIINSQTIKPGNYMPPMYLDAEQVDALIAYLETLD